MPAESLTGGGSIPFGNTFFASGKLGRFAGEQSTRNCESGSNFSSKEPSSTAVGELISDGLSISVNVVIPPARAPSNLFVKGATFRPPISPSEARRPSWNSGARAATQRVRVSAVINK